MRYIEFMATLPSVTRGEIAISTRPGGGQSTLSSIANNQQCYQIQSGKKKGVYELVRSLIYIKVYDRSYRAKKEEGAILIVGVVHRTL